MKNFLKRMKRFFSFLEIGSQLIAFGSWLNGSPKYLTFITLSVFVLLGHASIQKCLESRPAFMWEQTLTQELEQRAQTFEEEIINREPEAKKEMYPIVDPELEPRVTLEPDGDILYEEYLHGRCLYRNVWGRKQTRSGKLTAITLARG